MEYTVDAHGIVALKSNEKVETKYEVTPVLEQT